MSEAPTFSGPVTDEYLAQAKESSPPELRPHLDTIKAACDSLTKAGIPFLLWSHVGPGWWQFLHLGDGSTPETFRARWQRFCELLGPALSLHSTCLSGYITEHAPDGSPYCEYRKGEMKVLREPKLGEVAPILPSEV